MHLSYSPRAKRVLLWIKRGKVPIRCGLIGPVQQPARDHLRLNFGGTLENIEDAGVAQNARDREFEREAVAAVDLQRVVGIGPRDARTEQFCHAGFQICLLYTSDAADDLL